MKRNHPSHPTAHTNPWQKSSSNARQGFVFHNKIAMPSSQKRGKLHGKPKGKLHGKPKASAHGASKASFKRKLCLLQNLCRHLPEEMRSIMRQVPVPGGWVGLWHCSSWSAPRLHRRLLGCRPVSLCSSQTHQSAAVTQFRVFILHIPMCTAWPQDNGQLRFKSISDSPHVPSFLHYSLWTLLQTYHCPSTLLPACTVWQSKVRSSADLIRLLIMCHELQWLWGLDVLRNAM